MLGGVHKGAGRGGGGSRGRGGHAPGGSFGGGCLLCCLGLVLLEALALVEVLVVGWLVGVGTCLLCACRYAPFLEAKEHVSLLSWLCACEICIF